LQGLIDEANQSLEESGTPSHEIMVIVLHREFTAGSIGITLAGGADYESKDITVIKLSKHADCSVTLSVIKKKIEKKKFGKKIWKKN
jgi:hypothetical protein